MISYSEVVKNKLISSDILNTIPQKCECGAEYQFTDNLNNICCPNRYCHLKVGKRLAQMANLLGIEGLGDTSCAKIVKEFGLKSPAQFYIVAQKELECKGVAGFKKKAKEFKKAIDKNEIELWRYVEYMSLPGIKSNAKSLFSGYFDINEFYNQLHILQVNFVGDRLGIKLDADSSVLAVNTYNTLMSYENELKTCVKFFNIKQVDGETINICITGGVKGYTNKGEFIRRLCNSFGDKFNIVQQSSVTSKTTILVADHSDDMHSSKYLKAQSINNKANKEVIKVLNSGDCVDYIRKLYIS